jgi:excisionase family DNA binding protein
MKLLSTSEAAGKLNVSVQRVHQFINEGRLPAQKVGRDYVIDESDLRLIADRAPGRPKTTPEPSKRATGQIRRTNGTSAGKSGKRKGGKK